MNKIEVIFNDNLVEFYDVWCEESLELMLWFGKFDLFGMKKEWDRIYWFFNFLI